MESKTHSVSWSIAHASGPTRFSPRGPPSLLPGVRGGIELLALVRLLDAPVDHVPQRRELVDLLLELGKLVGMVVDRKGVAHGARHAGPGKFGPHLLLGGGIAM